MTDDTPGVGDPALGPPWSVDTLADLHAGALDEDTAARLWPQVEADPEARDVMAALDTTTAELGELGSAPAEPMPRDVANRIDAALAAEAGQAEPEHAATAPVVSLATARRKRNRLLGWGAGIVTTAAAAVVAITVISPTGGGQPTQDQADPGGSTTTESRAGDPSVIALQSGNLDKAVGSVRDVRDYGPLRDRERLDACLNANGIDPDRRPTGVRPATIDGQRAVIVLYPTGETAQYRLIALSASCGKDNPGMLADRLIGRGSG